MFQCAEHQIECLDRLSSPGCVHPFEKTVDEGVVLEGVFRAPLAHWMRIAPLAAAVATAHKRVMADHEGFNGRYGDCRGNEHHSSGTTTSRPDVTVDALVERDLAAAPGVLPPANLPLVRHRRGRLHRAYGHAGRDQHCARTEPRCPLLLYGRMPAFERGRSLARLDGIQPLVGMRPDFR